MTRFAHVRRPMAATPSCRRSRERGASLLEAAFAIPIFFVFLLAFVDLGLGVLQTSQATSAASDGARAGIIDPTDTAAIEAAVKERLAGAKVGSVTITCLKPGGTTVDCASSELDPETDRIRVVVKWRWKPVGPVGHAFPVQDIVGSSTMDIVPQPEPSSTPAP